MHENFNGQFFYKNRFYSWKLNVWEEIIKVYDSNFKELRKIKMPYRILERKNEMLELIKRELDKPEPQTTTDYTAYDDVRDEGVG